MESHKSHRWQEQYFKSKSDNLHPAEKADALRNLLSEVQYNEKTKSISPFAASNLFRNYSWEYMSLVDRPDDSGLNNYAEVALALSSGARNESQEWKTSFTSTKLENLDCVKKLKEAIQEYGALSTTIDQNTHKHCVNNKSRQDTKQASTTTETKKTFKFHSSKPSTISSPSITERIPSHSPGLLNSVQQPASVQQITSVQEPPSVQQLTSLQQPSNLQQTTSVHPQTNGQTKRWFSSSNSAQQPGLLGSNTGQNLQANSFVGMTSNPFYQQVGKHKKDELKSAQPILIIDDEEDDSPKQGFNSGTFKTAKEQLVLDQQKKYGNRHQSYQQQQQSRGYGRPTNKKSLGTRRGPAAKFVPPMIKDNEYDDPTVTDFSGATKRTPGLSRALSGPESEEPVDERLKNIDPKMIEHIMSEVMDHGPPLTWDDIAGLEFAKTTIKEIVVWPMLRPDIFTGLRGPPKGLLLFGPPGTGKTLIGKCIASQSKSTFFSISASSVTSKWVGEGEKMVKTLFAVARCNQPAVIFIDEVDSLLTQRTDGENEASRRIKTEFLVQLDGATTGTDERLLVVGATNRPQELDEAARRRFVKRLYIPLPEFTARQQIIKNLLTTQKYHLTDEELSTVCDKTDGYSGADMSNLCREAALGPIRSISFGDIEHITADDVRPITFVDFEEALCQVRASVSNKDLDLYIDWNGQYGSGHK